MRKLLPNKQVRFLKFIKNNEKFSNIKEKIRRLSNETSDVQIILEKGLQYLKVLYRTYAGNDETVERKFKNIDDDYKNYIIYKIAKICTQYNRYKKYFQVGQFDLNPDPITNEDLVLEFARKFCNDQSHITIKVKQLLNFIRFKDQYYSNENHFNFHETIHIHELVKLIEDLKFKSNILNTIELIPPSIFDVELIFSKEYETKETFEMLSSGEKQSIFNFSNINYILSNLESVFRNNDDGDNQSIKYQHIKIIMDEIELYHHPEFQRTFVSDLLRNIRNLNLEHITGINCIFVTHSPFILSDIPLQNILFLENGESKEIHQKTFAANIHDLLT